MVRRLIRDPQTFFLFLITALLLFIFIGYPIFNVLGKSLSVEGEFSAGNFKEFFHDPFMRRTLTNSLFMALISTAGAMAVGFCFAYLIVRTDIPGKGFFQLTAILPLLSPPFVIGLAFILLFGRRGLLTYGLLGKPVDVYGWHGLFFVQVLAFYPLAYLLLSGCLRSLNPNLEYAAHNLGGSGSRVFRTVTLPLLTPPLLGAALLIAVSVLADFGNPLLIGGDFSVLATEAWLQVAHRLNLEIGAALCMVLLIPSIGLFFMQHYVMRRKSYITVTGAPSQLSVRPVRGSIKWSLFAICSLVSVVVLLKYVSVVLGAFTKVWGVDYSLSLENLRIGIGFGNALRNSITLALGAATFAAVLGVITSYLIIRKRFLGRPLLDLLSVLPLAIPGTVMGIGYILAFNKPPFLLHGTWLCIMLNIVFRTLPIGVRAGAASLRQISPSIEEASANLGANTFQTIGKVVAPLMKSAFAAGFVYTFLKALTTLSAVIFLIYPGCTLASTSIIGLAEHGYWGHAAALSFLLILITVTVLALLRVMLGRKVQLFQFQI